MRAKMEDLKEPIAKKIIEEFEVINSDRESLCKNAIDLISNLVEKRRYGHDITDFNPNGKDIELTLPEKTAYEAALYFLSSEFEKGSHKVQSVLKKRES